MGSMDLSTTEVPDYDVADPTEHLFMLHENATEVFTVFSDLPTEIRLKIWRLLFPPPRTVNFKCYHYRDRKRDGFISNWNNSTKILITLYINRESREETLRHYRIFLRAARADGEPKMQPLIFNPRTDKVAIPYTSFIRLHSKLELQNWEANMALNPAGASNFLSEIKEFHIYSVVCMRKTILCQHNRFLRNSERETPDGKFLCHIFELLPNLQTIFFHMESMRWQWHSKEQLGVLMRKLVKSHEKSFVDGKVPDVVVIHDEKDQNLPRQGKAIFWIEIEGLIHEHSPRRDFNHGMNDSCLHIYIATKWTKIELQGLNNHLWHSVAKHKYFQIYIIHDIDHENEPISEMNHISQNIVNEDSKVETARTEPRSIKFLCSPVKFNFLQYTIHYTDEQILKINSKAHKTTPKLTDQISTATKKVFRLYPIDTHSSRLLCAGLEWRSAATAEAKWEPG